jgi:alpha-tubulin suppressor-like RCC1 family protein
MDRTVSVNAGVFRPFGWIALALTAVACESEFASEPAASAVIEERSPVPAQLTAGDSRVIAIKVVHAGLGELDAPRATWRSSNENVLRVQGVPISGSPDSVAVDSLSARRTRVVVYAVGSGDATLTVTTEASSAISAAERTFAVNVAPLVVQRVGTRSSYGVAEADTLRVRILKLGGDSVTARRVTWSSSNEAVLRVEAVSPGSAGDIETLLADNRLKVRLVAMRPGAVIVTAQVSPSPDMLDTPALSIPITVTAIDFAVGDHRDSVAVSEIDTIQVSLSTPAPLRLTWRSSDESRLRVEPLSFVGNAQLDTMAARRMRIRVVGLQRGVVDLTASIDGLTPDLPELRLRLTVLPLQILPLSWPDTLSVADSVALSVRIVDPTGREVRGLSVAWTSSDESSFVLTGMAAAGRRAASARVAALRPGAKVAGGPFPSIAAPLPSSSTVWGAAIRRDSIRVSLRIDGVASPEAAPINVPIRVMERWVDVATGFGNTCALSYDGRPYCWGQQTGGSSFSPRNLVPARISSAFQDLAVRYRRLAGGAFLACGESATTTSLWTCWGDNGNGLIGGASAQQQLFAVSLWPGVFTPRTLAIGSQQACGLSTASSVIDPVGTEYMFCWSRGSLPTMVSVHDCFNGIGTLGCANNNELVSADEIAIGYDFVCATGPKAGNFNLNSFHLFSVGCWGGNTSGQLGNDQFPGVTKAIPVLGLPGRMHGIVATDAAACALSSTGQAWCWGSGFSPTAVAVHSSLSFDHLTASDFGMHEICGATTSGTVHCWADAATAVQEPMALPVAKLRASVSHKCAIVQTTGAMYCWGNNEAGQLGNGTLAPSTNPVRVTEPRGRP